MAIECASMDDGLGGGNEGLGIAYLRVCLSEIGGENALYSLFVCLFVFVYLYMYVRLHSYTNIIFIDFF